MIQTFLVTPGCKVQKSNKDSFLSHKIFCFSLYLLMFKLNFNCFSMGDLRGVVAE